MEKATADIVKFTYAHEDSVHLDHIVQNFQLVAEDYDQRCQILRIIIEETPGQVLVLTERVQKVKYIAKQLTIGGTLSVTGSTGHGPQHLRERNLSRFKKGDYHVFVYTIGLLGRGLNLPHLTQVIFSQPPTKVSIKPYP